MGLIILLTVSFVGLLRVSFMVAVGPRFLELQYQLLPSDSNW